MLRVIEIYLLFLKSCNNIVIMDIRNNNNYYYVNTVLAYQNHIILQYNFNAFF